MSLNPEGPRTGRRRASHSMEAVLTETVRLLDEAGEAALTFRALAARLGGGVASIYWYVQSKDELLDRAADHVMAAVLEDTERFVDDEDPINALRNIGVTLYDAAVDRPWLGNYFMRNTGFQPNSLRLYERIGGQVLRLHLTTRQSFHAASAVVGVVIGLAADMGQQPPEEVVSGAIDRDQFMGRVVAQWRSLEPAEYPFLHTILDEFEGHRDADQFRAAFDLLLDGLRQQVSRRPAASVRRSGPAGTGAVGSGRPGGATGRLGGATRRPGGATGR